MPYSPERHGPRRVAGPGLHARVHELVRRVPAGAVTSYGAIAQALGSAAVARHVGYALAALPADSDVPWWRVIAANGRLARAGTAAASEQARRLRREGLAVRRDHVLDFEHRAHVFA